MGPLEEAFYNFLKEGEMRDLERGREITVFEKAKMDKVLAAARVLDGRLTPAEIEEVKKHLEEKRMEGY
jgi:hypothetical protein